MVDAVVGPEAGGVVRPSAGEAVELVAVAAAFDFVGFFGLGSGPAVCSVVEVESWGAGVSLDFFVAPVVDVVVSSFFDAPLTLCRFFGVFEA